MKVEFGYSPPVGDREFERINPGTFVGDLNAALRVASTGFTDKVLAHFV